MSQVARDAQLNRENLYRMLSLNGNPQLSSLTALLRSIGLRLAIQPDQVATVREAGSGRGAGRIQHRR